MIVQVLEPMQKCDICGKLYHPEEKALADCTRGTIPPEVFSQGSKVFFWNTLQNEHLRTYEVTGSVVVLKEGIHQRLYSLVEIETGRTIQGIKEKSLVAYKTQ